MTPDELKAKLGLGNTIMMQGRELKDIAEKIKDGEHVGKGALCTFKGATGLMVATNTRVIFVSKVLFTSVVEEFNYDRISSVEVETSLLKNELILSLPGTRLAFAVPHKAQAKEVTEYIKEQINKPKADHVIHQTIHTAIDPAEQIAKLAALKQQGILTEEEFTAKKKQLLGL